MKLVRLWGIKERSNELEHGCAVQRAREFDMIEIPLYLNTFIFSFSILKVTPNHFTY